MVPIAGWSSQVARQAHNLKVVGSNPTPATTSFQKCPLSQKPNNQWLTCVTIGQIDTVPSRMNEAGDKMVTNAETDFKARIGKRGKAGPIAKVKFGSASVPIYLSQSNGRKRYFVAHYRDGKWIRKAFVDLAGAKKEAMFVAQRIQSGLQHVTDINPHERDSYVAAVRLLEKSGVPLVAAVEDYMRAREKAGTESLAAMADEYGRIFKKVVRRSSAAEVVEEMINQREQDGASKAYLRLLKTTLTRFAAKFPGDLIEVDTHQIDAWLRSLDVAAYTRNSMLRCIKIFHRRHTGSTPVGAGMLQLHQ